MSNPYYDHHAARLVQSQGQDRQFRLDRQGILAPFLGELQPNSRVIDLGCGWGLDLEILASEGHQAFGLDASKAMAELAQAQHRNMLFWSPGLGEWDGVWAHHSFAHLKPEEAQRVIASSFRGLKPGGVLGVIVPEGTEAFEDREGDLAGPSRWIHPYTEKQLGSMIEQTGFHIVQVGRRSAGSHSELLMIAKRISAA